MLARGHGDACRVHAAPQRSHIGEDRGAEFVGHAPGAFRIRVYDANKFDSLKLAIDTHVITSEIADANDRHTNAPVRHLAFAPAGSLPPAGSFASGAKASTEIPASSAASMRRARSKSKVRSASIARAVALERLMTSTVCNPTTGTSKRMSWRGLATFTTTRGLPAARRGSRS